jgi:ribosomal protein S18 acetylase RimI-like enzyme
LLIVEELEAKDQHVSIAAREDGKIVGYILATINNMIHHHGERLVQTHSIYIKPSRRHSSLGKQLIEKSESLLYHKKGLRMFCIASNVNVPINGFLEKLGYKATDIIFTKRFQELP